MLRPFKLYIAHLSLLSLSSGEKGKQAIKFNLSNVKAHIKPKIFLVLTEEFSSSEEVL